MENSVNILVEFSIGRGGRFNNGGHVSFLGYEGNGKSYVENNNFLKFENESEIILEHEDEVENIADLITDLDNQKGDSYDEFCKQYGDLGNVIVADCDGNEIGDYVEDGLPFFYNEDNEYNSTYGKYLKDCTEDELELIARSDSYKDSRITSFLEEFNSEWKFDRHGYLIELQEED